MRHSPAGHLLQALRFCITPINKGVYLVSNNFETAARLLRDAYTAGTVPPLREWLDPTDAAGAYAVQEINTRFWAAQGRRIV